MATREKRDAMEFAFISWQSALVAASFFAAGLIDSISGGGGLITVPAFMAMGMPVHCIAGTNQCAAAIGNFASMYKYFRSGKMHIRSGLITGVTAIAGGILGAKLNMLLPEKYLQIIMLVLMPFMALTLIVKKDMGTEDKSDTLTVDMVFLRAAIMGLAIGAYQGFYGPGAGTLYMLGFAVLMRLDLVKASGTAKLATAFGAISCTVTYALSGYILWKVVLVAAVFDILGNWLGAGLAIKNGAKTIKPVLIAIMVLLFVKIAIDLL